MGENPTQFLWTWEEPSKLRRADVAARRKEVGTGEEEEVP